MDLIFLGTGSAYPSPYRGASGLILRHRNSGNQWLFDCGEGSQIQVQRCLEVKAQRITRIFISHLHGDHIFGLPGLLATSSNQRGPCENGKPDHVQIYGPKGLRKFIRVSIGLTWSRLNFNYSVHELVMTPEQIAKCWPTWIPTEVDSEKDTLLEFERPGQDLYPDVDGFWTNIFGKTRNEASGDAENDWVVHGFVLKHPIPCIGWLMLEPAPPRHVMVDRARAAGVKPGPLLGKLKKGETVSFEGSDGKTVTVHPEDVLSPAVRGRRLSITGDSCDTSQLRLLLQREFPEEAAKRSSEDTEETGLVLDLLVHEATNHSNQGNLETQARGHTTAKAAAQFASTIGVRQLVLTHFSQRYLDSFEGRSPKDTQKYDLLNDLLVDAQSCCTFKGTVTLGMDLKILPIVTVPGS